MRLGGRGNAHEAIISRMDFDAVQILMSRDTIAVAGKRIIYVCGYLILW